MDPAVDDSSTQDFAHAEQAKVKLHLFVLANLKLTGSKFQLNPIICAKLKSLTNPSSMPGYFTEERSWGVCKRWEAAQGKASRGRGCTPCTKACKPARNRTAPSQPWGWTQRAGPPGGAAGTLLCKLHSWSPQGKTRKGKTTLPFRLPYAIWRCCYLEMLLFGDV